MFTVVTVFLYLILVIAIWIIKYLLTSKKYNIIIRIFGILLIIGIVSIGVYQLKLFEKLKSYSISYVKTIDKKDASNADKLIKESLTRDIIKENEPSFLVAPIKFEIRYTDPINPTFPHGIFYVLYQNNGTKKIIDIDIKWDINDNGRPITPPDRWSEVIGKKQKMPDLEPNQNYIRIYGPEIGNSTISNLAGLELILSGTYKDGAGNKYDYYCHSNVRPEKNEDGSYSFKISEIKNQHRSFRIKQ